MLLGRAFASSGGTRVLSIIARFPRARGKERSMIAGNNAETTLACRRTYAVAVAMEKELEETQQEEPRSVQQYGQSTLGEALSGTFPAASTSSAEQQDPRVGPLRRAQKQRTAVKASKSTEAVASQPSAATSYADAFFANLTTKGKDKERSHRSLPMVQYKLERRRIREAQKALPLARRTLIYRSVLAEDIKDAERRFSQFSKGLDEEIVAWQEVSTRMRSLPNGTSKLDKWARDNPHPRTVHADTLRAHLNHLLYLSARAGSTSDYDKFSALFEEYDLGLNSRTHLTRLIMLDRKPHVSLARMTRIWKDWKQSSDRDDSSLMSRSLEDARIADETVLTNQTIWMLAKRGHWRIVGPVYGEILRNTPSAISTPSNAFPAEYFTPANLLSGIYPAFDQSRVDKVTYQSLIRALGFHGNVIAALNVMGDMLRDGRSYTADVSDYIAVMQGFARFGNSLEPEEAHRRQARRLSFHSENDLSRDLLEIFPPLIFPDPLPLVQLSEVGSVSSDTLTSAANGKGGKTGGLRKLTEIWESKIDGWTDNPGGAQVSRERMPGMDISILTKVFRAMLGTKPSSLGLEGTVPSRSSRYYATSRRASLAPTPKAVFIVLMAFARCSDGDPEVLKSVWADLEDKFGPANEEGWVGWQVDKRLKRIVGEITKV